MVIINKKTSALQNPYPTLVDYQTITITIASYMYHRAFLGERAIIIKNIEWLIKIINFYDQAYFVNSIMVGLYYSPDFLIFYCATMIFIIRVACGQVISNSLFNVVSYRWNF